ncbi:MAG TPA: hypothetical protein VN156_10385, partial [Pseudomonas sp.]|nr:hypothetical protein [Pseudomonas sp.]
MTQAAPVTESSFHSSVTAAQSLDGCTVAPLSGEQPLPLLVQSLERRSIHELSDEVKALAVATLETTGGVLF